MAISYGSRGSEVRNLQKQLNDKGAKLTVDGIWGPKTQSAYKKYGGASVSSTSKNVSSISNNSSNYSAPGLSYISFTPLTDAQKLNLASSQVNPAYDAEMKALESEYKVAKQNNRNDALTRGMSRSSYVMDVSVALDANRAESISDLEGERAAQLQSIIYELTEKDNENRFKVLKYNNDVALQLEKMRQTQLNEQRDYEIALKKLSSSSSSKSKSSSSSSSNSSTSKTNTYSNYYEYYTNNYLKRANNNKEIARALYMKDRSNISKSMGNDAVYVLDAIILKQSPKKSSISR